MGCFVFVALLSLIVTLCAANVENNQPISYRLASLKNDTKSGSVKACTKPNVMACSSLNCRDRVMCSSSLQETYVDTCTSGTICIDGACVKPPKDHDCDPYKDLDFECAGAGIFPDPGDCKVYHVCARQNPENELEVPVYKRVVCEGPTDVFSFNPKTGLCDKKLTNGRCGTYPIPLCTGRVSLALAANPTYYYDCLPHPTITNWYYPVQQRCNNNQKFTPSTRCK